MYAKAIRNLAKEYQPILLVTPLELEEIPKVIKTMIRKMNPDCDIIIKRLYIYYDVKLVTFDIDRDTNLIIQFPVFIQPYTQQLLVLY